MLFLLAGFDTTSSLLFYVAYQLALCREVQQELLEEINSTWEKNGGEFTYEAISSMEFLDKVVNETLRMNPPAPRLFRTCTKDYQLPNSKIILKKGQMITIPTLGIHKDSDIYPDPEVFDPERFSTENKGVRHPYSFLPFGQGPRNCIGLRFALVESKIVVAHLIKNFHLEPCPKTDVPLKFKSTSTLNPTNGIWLKLTSRN